MGSWEPSVARKIEIFSAWGNIPRCAFVEYMVVWWVMKYKDVWIKELFQTGKIDDPLFMVRTRFP